MEGFALTQIRSQDLWPRIAKENAGQITRALALRQPGPEPFLPLAMSFGALATVLIYVALFGPAPQADEGTAAHIWQILMAGQIPIILLFSIKWLRRTPKQALLVLALQGGAALMALAPVFLLKF